MQLNYPQVGRVNPPTEKIHGTAMQFFDQVAAQMGVEVEYIYYPLAHVLFMLESNRIDAVLMLAKNEKRSKEFVYPSTPMFTTIPAIAVLSNSELKTIDQVVKADSLTIGVWRGGYHSPTLDKNKNTIIELTGNNIASRGLEILARKKVDALFSPDSYPIIYAATGPPLRRCSLGRSWPRRSHLDRNRPRHGSVRREILLASTQSPLASG